MREIKFRAWDKDVKKMMPVGALGLTKTEGTYGNCDHYDKEIGVNICWQPFYELMQFTGLHDKNGKEIYEGDIVHFKADGLSGLGVIQWNEPIAAYEIDDIRSHTAKRGYRIYPFYADAKYRVDGNIYENPGLLD